MNYPQLNLMPNSTGEGFSEYIVVFLCFCFFFLFVICKQDVKFMSNIQ